jgi:phage terminase small subunit
VAKDDLTPKQEAFAKAYVETGNASEAYRRAYDAEDMKPDVINVKACELLKHGKVSVRVEELQLALQKRHDITMDKVVQELAKIGFSNMLDYMKVQEDGSAYVDLSQLTRDQAAAIGEVTSETYYEKDGEDSIPVKRTKLKLNDKRAALVDLGKHLGMFKDTVELTGKGGGPIETKDVSDIEKARRIAFMLGRAIGKQDAKKTEDAG